MHQLGLLKLMKKIRRKKQKILLSQKEMIDFFSFII